MNDEISVIYMCRSVIRCNCFFLCTGCDLEVMSFRLCKEMKRRKRTDQISKIAHSHNLTLPQISAFKLFCPKLPHEYWHTLTILLAAIIDPRTVACIYHFCCFFFFGGASRLFFHEFTLFFVSIGGYSLAATFQHSFKQTNLTEWTTGK